MANIKETSDHYIFQLLRKNGTGKFEKSKEINLILHLQKKQKKYSKKRLI